MTFRSRFSALVAAAVVITSASLAAAASREQATPSSTLPGVNTVLSAECSLAIPAHGPLGY